MHIPTKPNNYIVYVLVNGDLRRVKGCATTEDVVDALAQYLREKEAALASEYYRCVVYQTSLVSPAFKNALLRKAETYV